MIDDACALLREHDRFLIATHIRPDGDAIGSQIGLGLFLKKMGKEVALINADPMPRTLEWLPGAEAVEVFNGSFDQRKRIAEADVAVVMDTNAQERLGDVGGPLRNSGARKLLIDHHTHPERWFDAVYHRDTAAAAGELVYEIICALDAEMIDADIATALYTAIMTDTGSFRYSSVTPAIHRVTADLLERGDISPAPIHAALYDNRSLASLRLLGLALDNITLRYGGRVGYTVATGDMLTAAGADTDDKAGLVSYVLSVEGVEAALIFSEASGGTKVSFRSAADTHVNTWAAAFGGGGHRNASGAYVKRPLDETIEAVLEAAPQHVRGLRPEEEPAHEALANGALSDENAALLDAMRQGQPSP